MRANRIWTRNVNLTIAKEPNCIVPDYLKYSTVSGNEKFAKIHCPRTVLYNWTGPLEWFKNCKVLQEPKYSRIDSDLIIQEATHDDEGDYTCKLIHNENGVSYAVTATRALKVKSKPESHFLIIPVIKAPLDNAMVEVEIVDYQSIYYIVAGFSVLLILISILTMLLKIFWIDFILLWRDMVGPYKTRNDGKIYDAYVIYPRNYKKHPKEASSVDYFVHQILPDVLENKCGYNLCIYGRDMLPGEDAVTAVETNIQKSRRHIFILTPQIMHSQGFAYEQEVALHCALIQNNSKVILIEMEPLTEQNELQFEEFQESLKHLIKTQGTIKWREDHMANKWSLNSKFWKHVRYQMPMPKKLPKRTINLVSLSVQGQ
ncbi:interleukin-1 receptor-like 1 [Rhynchocyon petersi]